ncbi:MAG: hypothetical protein A4E59_00158 [Syntrophorhabdus sp. PtaB.Bin027]|jgi:hypothetical protein|nr:MAG: hypothetical protein A4E59_00158 [Syntrophorhabdus sp. PtaB.Bin027]OQB77776.1 MAG: hypothetical protein BWX92_00657 [Deltaproteobacteria bacterium ADurb.Bin135]
MATNNYIRNSIPITFNGKTQSIYKWALETKIPYTTLLQRIRHSKWDLKRALTEPVRHKEKATVTLKISKPMLQQLINEHKSDIKTLLESIIRNLTL